VKARDGTTDICGTFYVQSNLDLKGKYPILDSAYPGPSTHGVCKTLSDRLSRTGGI